MTTDTIRDERMGKFIKALVAYDASAPTISFAKIYKAFVENFSDAEQHAIEVEYIAQEYRSETGKLLDANLADIIALIVLLALNPDVAFDNPHVFQNATRLLLGLSPNYEEALYTPSFQYAEAYVVLNYLLLVPYTLSPLSTATADVIAMSVYKDGTNYFPDKRVAMFSLPELISGDNNALKFKIKKVNELLFDEILPAVYASKDKVDFAAKLKVILEADESRTATLYKALPMVLLTASTFFQVKHALKK